MALIPANIELLAFATQVDKATPATVPLIATVLESNTLDPGVQKITTPESDASAQSSNLVVVGAQPGGDFQKYLRPSEDDFFLYCLLGKNVDSGTTPKVHTANIDPAAPFSSPYLTIWDIWPGVTTTRYDGCRITQAVITGQPGGPISVQYTVSALKATLQATEPSYASLIVNELEHTWPELTATLGGVAGGVTNNISLTINRNTGRFVGDNGLSSLDIPNGLLLVSGSLEVAFQDSALMRAANTGSTSGTVLTTTVFTESLVLDFLRSANLETKFTLANAQISNFKTLLKTDGSPAVSTFDFQSLRSATISDQIQTVVKNAVALGARS